jgi:S-layer homology domain
MWRVFAVVVMAVIGAVTPAYAQPFSDTPANHWAYDAIAELAAKGLIEGYPDGTFRGDRGMTRYEMAMVVVRLLARIESIQIPTPAPPPKPEVTKADFDKILRLVNEFRAELAAKNVQLTAVEEELNAIKAKLDDVRITGAVRFRYQLNQFAVQAGAGPLPGNGNPQTGAVDATNTAPANRIREALRVTFDGSVAPNVHFIFALATSDGTSPGYATFNSSLANQFNLASIDNAFFQWKNAFGWPLEIWLGRFGGGSAGLSTAIGHVYPVQFGPFGLLLNTQTDLWADTTNNSGANSVDGMRLYLRLESLADLQFQAVWARIAGNTGAFSFPSGEDMYGGDISFSVFPGLRLGGYYVANTIGQFGSAPFVTNSPFGVLYHLYGPAAGSANPGVTAAAFTSGAGGLRCIASGPGTAVGGSSTVAGINCPAAGNGWGAYASWNGLPGITVDVEAAQWNDATPNGGQDRGFNTLASFDLAKLLGIGTPLTVLAGYAYYGPNFYPPYGNVSLDYCCWDFLYPGNSQGFIAETAWTFAPRWTISGTYLTGNHVSNSQPILEYEANLRYQFAPNSSVLLKFRDMRISGIDQFHVYWAQLDYTF